MNFADILKASPSPRPSAAKTTMKSAHHRSLLLLEWQIWSGLLSSGMPLAWNTITPIYWNFNHPHPLPSSWFPVLGNAGSVVVGGGGGEKKWWINRESFSPAIMLTIGFLVDLIVAFARHTNRIVSLPSAINWKPWLLCDEVLETSVF